MFYFFDSCISHIWSQIVFPMSEKVRKAVLKSDKILTDGADVVKKVLVSPVWSKKGLNSIKNIV